MLRFLLLSCLFLASALVYGQESFPNASSIKVYRLAESTVDITEAHSLSLEDETSEVFGMMDALKGSLKQSIAGSPEFTAQVADLITNQRGAAALRVTLISTADISYTVVIPVYQADGWYQLTNQYEAVICKIASCDGEVEFTQLSCTCGSEQGELTMYSSSM